MGKKTKDVPISPRNAVQVQAGATDAETLKNAVAVICGPDFAAFRVIHAADGQGALGRLMDAPILMKHLRDQAGEVQGGNMTAAEAMLMNQATALQSLFARLVERGMGQSQMPYIEGFLRLALRSQNQCRATLETLAAIKNPPVVFAKQANITNGPQQVNNGIEAPRARENEIEQTQLLEDTPRERLDFGTTETTSEVDSAMAAMGEIDRAKNRRGQKGQRYSRG